MQSHPECLIRTLLSADERSMKFVDGKICPHCQTESLHRSHRRRRDWLFHLLGLRPMRCICCTERFYSPKPRTGSTPARTRLN